MKYYFTKKSFRRDKPSKSTTATATAVASAAISNRTKDQRTAKINSDDVSALSLKVDNKNRDQIVEHHNTLPISYYKQKKRTTNHRKNATLERTTTKKTNETLLLIADAQPKPSSTSTVEVTSKMHYHNTNDMPRYLFGERTKQQQQHHQQQPHFPKSIKSDEIYLNKSGWVQVHQREFDKSPPIRYASRDQSFQKYSNAGNSAIKSTTNFSKLEALISRNENRKNIDAKLITKCAIDPNVSALLSERPGFLPIKRFDENESPPPITPIISPPPAFQDNNGSDGVNVTQPASIKSLSANGHQENVANNKGMVFSRSFEYDTRKPYEYNQTFSKSFDYDFLSPSKEEKKIEKENNFVNLTGVSPNYLSKKPNSSGSTVAPITTTAPATAAAVMAATSRDTTSVYQQYLEPKTYADSVRKSRIRTAFSLQTPDFTAPTEQQQQQIERSRRGQFAKQESSSSSGGSQQLQQPPHGFRAMHSSVNKRLNSCDSGARSGMHFPHVSFVNEKWCEQFWY